MNVIVFNKIEHDVSRKTVPTFLHHALDHPCREKRTLTL